MKVDLSLNTKRGYTPGRAYWYRALWLIVEALVLLNPLVGPSFIKRWVLRSFGARIGRNVLIKPSLHVKYPWLLEIGENAWIGERVWIDNFRQVRIGANACISQGAYLCTGNHDWSDPGMGLVTRPITVENGAWVGAFCLIGPGVTIGEEAVITLGAVVLRDAEPRRIYSGNPAACTGERVLRDRPGPP
jgi:putative colanic acid biosynthesis acetyltransferase WcaF